MPEDWVMSSWTPRLHPSGRGAWEMLVLSPRTIAWLYRGQMWSVCP